MKHETSCSCPVCRGTARRFTRADWIGKTIMCPHCGKLLDITEADGPYVGQDQSEKMRIDTFWIVTLSDGTKSRMWEDRKCVLLNADGTDTSVARVKGARWTDDA